MVYDFRHDLERLLKLLGPKTPYIGGGVTARESDRIIVRWNAGELPYLLVHPAAVAHGLQLQEGNAQHVIWHSLTEDYELYDQLIRRLRRSGNKAKTVTSHRIVAVDTVDELTLKRQSKKQMTQDELNRALQEYTLRRRRRRR